jgi:putative hydrolase of the HAD superfamily
LIRAVSFDLWFTLIWETKEDEEIYVGMRVRAIKDFLKSSGYDIEESVIREAYAATKEFRMLLPARELLGMILMGLGVSSDVDGLARAYEESTDGFTPRLNQEAPEVLRELKRRGIKLALVSNTSFSARSIRGILRNVGLDLFDVILSSSDLGLIKPQAEIFRVLKSELGLDGSQIIHVGDSCYQDVIGAMRSGLRAVHYTKLAELRGSKVNCGNLPRIESLWQLLDIIETNNPP